jgi:hypothetical protein
MYCAITAAAPRASRGVVAVGSVEGEGKGEEGLVLLIGTPQNVRCTMPAVH